MEQHLMRNKEIIPFTKDMREELIGVWERSVRATHHFVNTEDLEYFKKKVAEIDYFSFSVFCLHFEEKLIGFIGFTGPVIEMLFLDPDYIGQGWGKKLMVFAIEEFAANEVEVNEQNDHAVQFYSKFGFNIISRTDTDPDGKDYPILKMKRY